MNSIQKQNSLQSVEFDYNELNADNRVLIQRHTRELKEKLQRTAQDIWEIGQKLAEVRARLKHGQFDAWLKAEFGWSRRTAYNFINVHETFNERAKFAQFNIATSALYLLASPSTPPEIKEQFIEAAATGHKVTHKDIRQALDKNRGEPQKSAEPVSVIDIDVAAKPQIVSITPPRAVGQLANVTKSPSANPSKPQAANWYLLARKHLLFHGDTTSSPFKERIPRSIPLALGIADGEWQHDWLLDKASAVLILQQATVDAKLIQRLVLMFSQPGESIIFPVLPSGEIIATVHNLQRQIYTGDSNEENLQQAIAESGLNAESVNIL